MTIHEAAGIVERVGLDVPYYRSEGREWVIGLDDTAVRVPDLLTVAVDALKQAGLHPATIRQDVAVGRWELVISV